MITNGAFTDIEAIFKTYDGDERVVILLNLMHREQQLVLPVSSIEKREGACA
jgi:transcriptional antiterminator RfaH